MLQDGRERMKILSRSILIMFLFDLLILIISTTMWYDYFNLPPRFYLLTVLLISASGIITLFLKANYKIREFNITKKNAYLLFEGIIFAHILAGLVLFFDCELFSAIKFLLANIFTIFVALKIYRTIFHFYLFNWKKEKNVLIIGTNRDAKLIANEIINKKALRMNISGFVEDTDLTQEVIEDSNHKIFKQPLNLRRIITENKIDIVIISIKRRMEETLLTDMILNIPDDVNVYKMSDFYELVTGKLFVDRLSINTLFYDFMNKRSKVYDFSKRVFDIVSALIILIITFPILLYIGIRVKLTDGGSPIYTQERVGKGGQIFKCYKLRTMYANNYVPKDVKHGGYAENQDEDDRVIPFCKFVRKARFDEIPQMINILKGEMSIVGPRTEWVDLVKLYSKEIPYYPCRQWVKTGWTGWAQINQGHCINNDDIAEKLQYDLYYLKNRNVIWEICILVKAVFLALGGRHG